MADTGNVLSARLEVKDSFSSQLDKFSQALNRSETAFNKFISSIDKSSLKIETSLDRINRKIDQTVNKITSRTESIANSIEKSTSKIEQSQNKAINNLTTKYMKMGNDVQGVFKNINKDAEGLTKSGLKINIGGNRTTTGKSVNDEMDNLKIFNGNKVENFLTGLISGNSTKMLGALGLIGAGITLVTKTLETISTWMQQGYNILNTLSTGLLSPSGIYEGAKEAGKFEQNRIAMDVLYGNNAELGQYYYKLGVQSAKATTYGEQDTGELQKKLAGAHISYNQDQLNLLADIATLKPNIPLEHVGFSIVDAMYGRTTSLKSMYMLDNKEVQAYLKELSKSQKTTDRTNAKLWKDAFNSKGAVKNKQQYFDLLMDFVINKTQFQGLNHKQMQTTLGRLDRLQGNWETLKAEVLGIDANNTGKVKSGSAMDALGKSLDNLSNWLEQSNTKYMLDSLGKSLGNTVSSVANTFEKFLQKVDWVKVGTVLEKIGDTISKIIDKLTSNPAFMNLIEKLPDIIDRLITNTAIDYGSQFNTQSQLAQGNVAKAVNEWGNGKEYQIKNYFGDKNALEDYGNNHNKVNPFLWGFASKDLIENKDNINPFLWGFGVKNAISGNKTELDSKSTNTLIDWFSPITGDKTYLTNANADTYLAQNPNLNEADRTRIKDVINEESSKGHNVYHITIGEVKTDTDPMTLINKIQNLQSNSK